MDIVSMSHVSQPSTSMPDALLFRMPPRAKVKAHPTKAVRLETFDIHGHNGNQPLDYVAFFRLIASLNGEKRRDSVADKLIAVPRIRMRDGSYELSAYIGSPEAVFLVLNLAEGSEEVRQLEQGQLLATRTVGLIDPVRRLAVIQYVHSGVRAEQIATLFEKVARANSPAFANASLEFAPRAGDEFRKQLQKLERVQSVTLTLTRPNADWTDYADGLTGVASDSNAHNVTLSASASRSQSLSKAKGAVRFLSDLISGKRRSILKSAAVYGQRADDDAAVAIKLNKLIEARTARVVLEGGMPDPAAVANAANDYIKDMDGER